MTQATSSSNAVAPAAKETRLQIGEDDNVGCLLISNGLPRPTSLDVQKVPQKKIVASNGTKTTRRNRLAALLSSSASCHGDMQRGATVVESAASENSNSSSVGVGVDLRPSWKRDRRKVATSVVVVSDANHSNSVASSPPTSGSGGGRRVALFRLLRRRRRPSSSQDPTPPHKNGRDSKGVSRGEDGDLDVGGCQFQSPAHSEEGGSSSSPVQLLQRQKNNRAEASLATTEGATGESMLLVMDGGRNGCQQTATASASLPLTSASVAVKRIGRGEDVQEVQRGEREEDEESFTQRLVCRDGSVATAIIDEEKGECCGGDVGEEGLKSPATEVGADVLGATEFSEEKDSGGEEEDKGGDPGDTPSSSPPPGPAMSRLKKLADGLAFNVFLGILIMAAVFAVGSTMLYAVQKIMVSSSQHQEAMVNRQRVSSLTGNPTEPIVHPKDLSAYLYDFNLRRRRLKKKEKKAEEDERSEKKENSDDRNNGQKEANAEPPLKQSGDGRERLVAPAAIR